MPALEGQNLPGTHGYQRYLFTHTDLLMSQSSRRRSFGASRRPVSVLRGGLVALVLFAVAACSTSTNPDTKPTSAEIRVTGAAPDSLQLVVSTDFFETIDQVDGTRDQVFNSADTSFITTLPYNETVALTDLGSIVVDVSNPSDVPATVRLMVEVNSGQNPYDREATMSEGGALRYVFNFFSPVFN